MPIVNWHFAICILQCLVSLGTASRADKIAEVRPLGEASPSAQAVGTRETMADLDAGALAQLATKIGLVTDVQVQEAWDELGQKGGEVEPFLRTLERKR